MTGRSRGRIGAACELLVRADLLKRGYEVTVPVNPSAKHDLHVDLPSVGWKGVSVKAARLYRKGVLRNDRGRSNSPVLALVLLSTGRIEYRPGTEELPAELK
jgi:hypothetical protein